MSFNLTYGAFGDLITTIQLICQLTQALSESRGARGEFQELVVELREFQGLLQMLQLFWQRKKQCPELNCLVNLVQPVITDCRELIEVFLEKAVTKYGRSLLRHKGSRLNFRDAFKMIQWNMCEKDEVKKLHHQLSSKKATILLAQQQAQGIADEQDLAIMSERISALIDAEQDAEQVIGQRLSQLIDKIDEEARTSSRIEGVVNMVRSTIASVSDNVVAIRTTVTNIEQAVLNLPSMIARLSLYSNSNTVFIEDSFGWKIPVLLDTQPSWETVHSIIRDQFTKQRYAGINLINAQRYILQHSQTGRDARTDLPFYQVARPGQTWDMSMIFHDVWDDALRKEKKSNCPACGCVNEVDDPDFDINCRNKQCRYMYRRVADISAIDKGFLLKQVAAYHSNHANCVADSTMDYDSDEDDFVTNGEERALQKCYQKAEFSNVTVEIFKRARLLSRWENRLESRADKPFYEFRGLSLWAFTHEFETYRFQMGVSICLQLLHHSDYINSCMTEGESSFLQAVICFMGRKRAQSVPTIVLYSQQRRVMKRALAVLKRLDWVRGSCCMQLILAPKTLQIFPSIVSDEPRLEAWRLAGVIMEEQP
ncbi:uncharacterized protein JN550_012345 [Neoarthrinium moseri]|uniref:uncharacterized protein n=1 Tax=Neoarthrinium moseri TaxID=1658444 RepID=UPI001FDDA6F5|nr:uncharacterized protein JN550_012345 [Neoarthrinium moseri]KAI1858886.1 hypothetical protein JN550_012345 [Neoarthrinium moseri]